LSSTTSLLSTGTVDTPEGLTPSKKEVERGEDGTALTLVVTEEEIGPLESDWIEDLGKLKDLLQWQ
jgi:hypothetical protein